MKTTFYLLLFVILFVVVFTSCHKDTNSPTPTQIDSLNAALPKEIITSYSSDSNGITVPGSYVVSIKYDTVNSAVQLYFDDTTTTNPYDILGETFTYNASGYLISVKESDDTRVNDPDSDPLYNVTVNRDANNKIIYISEVSKDGSLYDSIFYNYQAAGTGTNITTILHYLEEGGSSGTDTVVYTYTSDNKLSQETDLQFDTYTYTFNTNNTIKSDNISGQDGNFTSNYTYASGLPDGKADAFVQALLGKDFYIPDLYYLDPFVYSYDFAGYYDDYSFSFTDPYHISASNLQGTNGTDPITETATWMYQLNAQNNVTQVIFHDSFNDMETVNIKY